MEERDTYRYDPGDKPKHKQVVSTEPDFHRAGAELIAQCPAGLSSTTVLALTPGIRAQLVARARVEGYEREFKK